MNLPRLTGALRAFASVTVQDDASGEGGLSVKEKRDHTLKQRSSNGLNWQKLVATLKKKHKGSHEELTAVLRELTHIAKEIAGKDSTTEVIEGCSVLLFQIFANCDKVSREQTTKIRKLFGPFPASAATSACSVVNRICNSFPDSVLDNLIQDNSHSETTNDSELFGKNIKFVQTHSTQTLGVEDNFLNSESDSDGENDSLHIDLKYTERKLSSVAADSTHKQHGIDAGWLRKEVEAHFGGSNESTAMGLSVMDICSTLFDYLTSSKTDSELQNDLFELLGFERFEFIQKLLENRATLISVTLDSATDLMFSQRPDKEQSRPNYGCQVTVQSEQERQMKKIIRREEKKISRKEVRMDEEQGEYLKALGFNPAELRMKREAELQAAGRAPLFSQRSARGQEVERYPYVFDQQAEARQSSAFVGGTKMYLPQGFERETYKMYEEVNIPPCAPARHEIFKERVPIASLDQIGQMAFKSTKQLNLIQSVVYEAAYTTNENLLICAPTGAGKTNIAMLTILHEIKQHLAQGVIKKDEFKIIYVAPMKALAAEMVRNFGGRLEPLGLAVKELTGDMQLTKQEILKTQMLVTTPEKWDVVTRKSTGDVALTQLVKLLIIDEVHLLHENRGAVIESLVARTLRQVESSQSMIRIVGLSATLPNYLDVARFLHVNPYQGLFFFDGRFRPVPLGQTYIGIKATNIVQQISDMNEVCYDKVVAQVKRGEQVMVFVHARNETGRTAGVLADIAKNRGESQLFLPKQSSKYGDAQRMVARSRNKQLRELFGDGFGTHHAGMLRADRNLVEKLFADGQIRVLVCTATLAWGVNLPAHAVIIKGTQLYDAKRGSFVDLGILDVMQIFGRAGRPQFDSFGHGTIITTHDKLSHYLSLMTQQNPIESQFDVSLKDNLNAEGPWDFSQDTQENPWCFQQMKVISIPQLFCVIMFKTLLIDQTLIEK